MYPLPLPLQFCPVSAAFMLFIRFIFAFRLGSGSLRPCSVSLVKVEALPLVSVLRGSDRIGTERKQKARVLPFGSALALVSAHVGTLWPSPVIFQERNASTLFLCCDFSAFIYFSCSSCCSCTKGVKSVFWFFFRSHGASLPGCQDPPALLKS